MARSVSNAKIVSAFVVDRISLLATRRGYAVGASQGAVSSSSGSRAGGMTSPSFKLKKGEESGKKTTSWVPDPVTGYYRPENGAKEIDAAELRKMLLKHKN